MWLPTCKSCLTAFWVERVGCHVKTLAAKLLKLAIDGRKVKSQGLGSKNPTSLTLPEQQPRSPSCSSPHLGAPKRPPDEQPAAVRLGASAKPKAKPKAAPSAAEDSVAGGALWQVFHLETWHILRNRWI